jgi:hypothetical protein
MRVSDVAGSICFSPWHKERGGKDKLNLSSSYNRAMAEGRASPSIHGLPTGMEAKLTKSMSELGGVRSLPTQIGDRPASINVNHLRGRSLHSSTSQLNLGRV